MCSRRKKHLGTQRYVAAWGFFPASLCSMVCLFEYQWKSAVHSVFEGSSTQGKGRPPGCSVLGDLAIAVSAGGRCCHKTRLKLESLLRPSPYLLCYYLPIHYFPCLLEFVSYLCYLLKNVLIFSVQHTLTNKFFPLFDMIQTS